MEIRLGLLSAIAIATLIVEAGLVVPTSMEAESVVKSMSVMT